MQDQRNLLVFSGNANKPLAQSICKELGVRMGKALVTRFSDGEVQVEIEESVRRQEVFVIQPTCAPSAENLMELLVLIDALKRASAQSVTAVIPYFGYSRQDRRMRSSRVPITAKVAAKMICAMGQTEAAARVLSTGPQDTQTYGLRASMLAKEKDRSSLEALYAELKSNATKPDPDRRLLLGKIAEFLKRYDEAVEWYRGVPGGPQLSEARLRAASALYELGRKPEALAEARALQGDASADDDARRDAYVLEAELHQRADDAPGELDAFERGLAAYPDDSALLYARGLAWERRDDVPRAEADLRKILVTEPENVAALNALGYTLADRTTRYKEALALIDRARTADPDNPAIVDSYGWVLYRMGRTKEALVQLRRAWALVKDPEIAAHVGEVLWVSGKQDEARRYFDEARRLDPDNRALQRAVEKFGL